MPKFADLYQHVLKILQQLSLSQKVVLSMIFIVVISALSLISFVSIDSKMVLLASDIETAEFNAITTKLKDNDYPFTTSGTDSISVKSTDRNAILMLMAQNNIIPKGVPGYELFDIHDWSETQFEKDIKKQRALMGEITKTLETLKSIHKARVLVSFPDDKLFQDNIIPVTAAIQLNYAPGYTELKRKEIMGITTLVSRSIPGLAKENVAISGPEGDIINDFDNELDRQKRNLQEVSAQLRIQEKERRRVLKDIERSLNSLYGKGTYGDRYDIIRLDIKLRWDEEEIERNEVSPVVMIPDNPNTPYSERKVQDSLRVSSKSTKESFEGNGFTPEGPTGTEPNIPPGYKDRDYQKAKYNKEETIHNNEFNKSHHKIKKQLWEYGVINLAVVLDGQWKRGKKTKDGLAYERNYVSVSDNELRAMTDLLKKAIGYDSSRGDQISVKHIQKDRTKQFGEEDSTLRAAKMRQRGLLIVLFVLLTIGIFTTVGHFIRRELLRRKKIREEELVAQQRLMREAALRAIEQEGVELEIPLEEKARQEMLTNVINMVKDKPESVAHLVRTWIATEE